MMLGVADVVVSGLLCQIWRHSLLLRRGISWAVFCMSMSAASLIHWYHRSYLWFFLIAVLLLAAMQPFCYKPSPYATSFPENASAIPGRPWNSLMMLSCLVYILPAGLALGTGHPTYTFSLLGNAISAFQYHRSKELVYYNLDNIFATFTMLLAVYTVWLAAPRELFFAPPAAVFAQCSPCPAYFYFMLAGVPFAGAVLAATGDNAFLQYILEPSLAVPASAASSATDGDTAAAAPQAVVPAQQKLLEHKHKHKHKHKLGVGSQGQDNNNTASGSGSGSGSGSDATLPLTSSALALPPVFDSQAQQRKSALARGLLWLCGACVAADPDPVISADGAYTGTCADGGRGRGRGRGGGGGDAKLPLMTLSSLQLPPLGSLLWSCQCHRVPNSVYETLHPWWHVASTLGPFSALAYLQFSCTDQVSDMGMDPTQAIGGGLELPLVSSIILVMCIVGVVLENYSGAKPPI